VGGWEIVFNFQKTFWGVLASIQEFNSPMYSASAFHLCFVWTAAERKIMSLSGTK
jgi:hypothetical protein